MESHLIISKPKKTKIEWTKHLLISPALLFFVALTIFPLLFTLFLSLNFWAVSGEHHWIGLGNYIKLFQDSIFLTSLRNEFIFVIFGVLFEYIFGLLLALVLNQLTRGLRLIRLAVILPFAATPAVVGCIWKMLFDQSYGPIPDLLHKVGLTSPAWLTQPLPALFSIIIVDIWEWTPFMFLIIFAGLKSLPKEPFESAMVDGASSWRIFWDLTFPMLMPTTIVVILLRTIEAFKIFDIVFLTTAGGPGIATISTTLYAYDLGLRTGNLGYAAAMSIILLIIVVLILNVFLKTIEWVRRRSVLQKREEALK
jgi:multiple sugar transport system permease protein